MYKKNEIKPRTEPWGTPHDVRAVEEEKLSMVTLNVLSYKYDENQLRVVLFNPHQVFRLSRRIL